MDTHRVIPHSTIHDHSVFIFHMKKKLFLKVVTNAENSSIFNKIKHQEKLYLICTAWKYEIPRNLPHRILFHSIVIINQTRRQAWQLYPVLGKFVLEHILIFFILSIVRSEKVTIASHKSQLKAKWHQHQISVGISIFKVLLVDGEINFHG